MPPAALPLLASGGDVDDVAAELARLHAEAPVWEPARVALLADLDLPAGARVLDVARHRGPDADHDGAPAAGTFDVVHARFQLGSLGHVAQQLAAYRRLLKPGGLLVLEEPDTRSWTLTPYAPATTHLVGRIAQVHRAFGADLDLGRRLPALLRAEGLAPQVRTHAIGLEAGHPYLRLPLQLADVLRARLADVLGADALIDLCAAAAAELEDPPRGGTTFTLVQAWARIPA
jgi:SAM-dependent methyltransferase